MMRSKAGANILGPVLFFALVGALMVGPATAAGQEEHRVQGSVVSVYNLAGTAEIVPGSGSDVVVRVMRGGRDSGRLEVDAQEVRGRQALIIRYPADEVSYPEMGGGSRTEVRVRADGTFGGGGSGGDRVRVSGRGNGMEAWADLRIEVPAGKDFALFLAVGETEASGVVGDLLIDVGSGAVRAQETRGVLNIDTGSGAVFVRDVQGDLLVDTGSGRVELEGVRGTEVNVDTGSGAVTGTDISASSLRVDTGSGRVGLRRVAAPDVYVDTGSGGVEIDLLEDVDRLVVDTGSGGVTVRVPASLGAQIELETGSGGIDLDLPLEVREIRRNSMRGTVGDGEGRISIDTGSGAIRLISG
ncbi:DUF4097 domain-containing protein [Gemmatimonadota bacterium]